MSVILIVIYCLLAAVIVFGLTFHNEMLDERRRQRNVVRSRRVTPGGKGDHRHNAPTPLS
jgi:hypothetical protein